MMVRQGGHVLQCCGKGHGKNCGFYFEWEAAAGLAAEE